MKYIHEPKPIEYEPLTRAKLEAQPELGPVSFRVSKGSHAKTEIYSSSNVSAQLSAQQLVLDTLRPSELWGCARVLSQYFGRLNEIAVSRTCWEIKGKAKPSESLESHCRLLSTGIRNNLPWASIETTTTNNQGEPLLTATDEFLLFHEVENWKYQARHVQDSAEHDLVIPRTVYFRHNWDPTNWKNNIHTDEYARKLGYERALPEFIMYLDWIFDAVYRQEGDRAYNSIINVPLILPLYQGDRFEVRLKREIKREKQDLYTVRFAKDNILRLQGTVQLL